VQHCRRPRSFNTIQFLVDPKALKQPPRILEQFEALKLFFLLYNEMFKFQFEPSLERHISPTKLSF
jgi:hypothetical protein